MLLHEMPCRISARFGFDISGIAARKEHGERNTSRSLDESGALYRIYRNNAVKRLRLVASAWWKFTRLFGTWDASCAIGTVSIIKPDLSRQHCQSQQFVY